ncbi:MAG: SDR family NAD(P)-dependent oxidoreductase [Phycisphaerales bacterium]|nr:SDR family NAD(P)-dependent oxidoreductase [Phycisphaerales bacterium]
MKRSHRKVVWKGARVWITGASTGIGRALAKELASCGAHLAITSRRTDVLEEVVGEICSAGGQAQAYAGDVTDADAMAEIAAAISQNWGGIDVLIANAGTHIPSEPLQFDSRQYQDLMQINYGGVLHCIEAVLPGMKAQGHGHIVGVASLAGYRALPTASAYGASKAALIHFLQSLRFHLEHESIAVTVINPGFVRTPLTDKNDFRMPCLIEASDAASRIRRALERGKRDVAFPAPFSWVISLFRIIPMPLYACILRRIWKKK